MFNGNILRDAIISGANNIYNQRQKVDELNVFPVPDGDTGTNMSMSIGNAARELARLQDETASQVAGVTASALLRGARGNSGVILSLLFRGFAKGLKDKNEVDSQGLCDAITLGVEAAYKAVMKPTEGTILTVARFAADYAKLAVADGKDALEVFEAMIEGASIALEQTPELLPVLKKAGVVDAGGKGLVVIFEGMLSVFKDNLLIPSESANGKVNTTVSQSNTAGKFDSEIVFTYCTEFIVKRAKDSEDPVSLRAYLETIGDCVVVVDDEQVIKVHVHTNHPGKALERAIPFGQLINLKIENMRDQHERAKHDSEVGFIQKATAVESEGYTPVPMEKGVGFVAIAAGEGLQSLFQELGADKIVGGGQTMNPSTDDILKAVELTPAETVFVLPNNKNIIMAAEQAIPLSTRKIIVLPTSTIPQGISAMLSYDPDNDVDQNAIIMQKAYEHVSTGQVTFAARDSNFDGHKITKGELLALANGKVAFTEQDLIKCVSKLAKSLTNRNTAFITLIYGENITEEQAEEVKNAVQEKCGGDIEISLINGGQPVYYFIISVEQDELH